MPKLTKAQLMQIAEKYNEIKDNRNAAVIFDKNYNTKYLSATITDTPDDYFEALAVMVLGNKQMTIDGDKIEFMLSNYHISVDQFFAIEDNIDDMETVLEIDEKGKKTTDFDYIEKGDNFDFKKYRDRDADTWDYVDVKEFANKEHKELLELKENAFYEDFDKDPANKVFFDQKFFDDLFKMKPPVEDEKPLYENAKAALNAANTSEDAPNTATQRRVAMTRINCYVALKNSFDQKGIGDFFKSPIKFIKEWWTLRGAKSDLQNKYHFSDNALENIENMVNQKETTTDFACLDEKGEPVSKFAGKEEVEAMNAKLNKGKNTKTAQQNLDMLKAEFDKDNRVIKGSKSGGIQLGVKKEEKSIDDYNI